MVEPNNRDFRCFNSDAAPAKGHDKVLKGSLSRDLKHLRSDFYSEDLSHFEGTLADRFVVCPTFLTINQTVKNYHDILPNNRPTRDPCLRDACLLGELLRQLKA
jgi:hypothetical protein